jgi:hypothetical protein
MKYKVKLIDRNGKQSPLFDYDTYADGAEFELDAEASHEYVKTARILLVCNDDNEVIDEFNVLGYAFYGDTIVNESHAYRNGNYILSVS